MKEVVSVEVIATKILMVRGKKVMLDKDLAGLYGVDTKALNQAVKRNFSRFPEDFMFQLTEEEKQQVVTNCDHLKALKFSYQLPYAFTQEGVAMLSSVLNSERAIQVNIAIMRAFIRLGQILSTHKGLAVKLETLEKKYSEHDEKIKEIFEAIRRLMQVPEESKRIIKGFGNEKRGLS